MTAKRQTAAELWRNLAGFEKGMRDRLADAEQALVNYRVESLKSYYEGRRDGFVNTLIALHIWTDGEFGDAPPSSEAAASGEDTSTVTE